MDDVATEGHPLAQRRKLQKIAAAARGVSLGGIFLMVGYQAYLLFNPGDLISSLDLDAWPEGASFSTRAGVLAWLISWVPSALFIAAMMHVRILFARLTRGSWFDPDISRLLRRIGQIAVAAAVAAFVTRTLVALVLTMGSPGSPHFVIGIHTEEVTALVVGLLLLAFALVMQEAHAIEQDNRGFV